MQLFCHKGGTNCPLHCVFYYLGWHPTQRNVWIKNTNGQVCAFINISLVLYSCFQNQLHVSYIAGQECTFSAWSLVYNNQNVTRCGASLHNDDMQGPRADSFFFLAESHQPAAKMKNYCITEDWDSPPALHHSRGLWSCAACLEAEESWFRACMYKAAQSKA